MNKSIRLMCVLTLLGLPLAAHAENWPSHLIKATIPFGAGSATDVVPRLVLDRLAVRARPADRGRELRRRRGHHRDRHGGQGRTRRLQHSRPFLGADDRAGDLPQPQLRRDEGSVVGADDRISAECDDRAGHAAMEDGAGFHGGGEAEGSRDFLRLGRDRQRRAYQRGEISCRRGLRGDPRPLPRRFRSDRRYSRRPDRFLFLSAGDGACR